jgi:hypothetical protein
LYSYHFHKLINLLDLDDLDGKEADWFHHWIDDSVRRINQNDNRAISQFIGDKWGIIKSPGVIKSWQDFVIWIN